MNRPERPTNLNLITLRAHDNYTLKLEEYCDELEMALDKICGAIFDLSTENWCNEPCVKGIKCNEEFPETEPCKKKIKEWAMQVSEGLKD